MTNHKKTNGINKKSIFSKLKNWYKANRVLFLMFLIGLVLLFISHVFKNGMAHEILPWVRLLTYISCFLMSLSAYIYLVKRKQVIFSNLILVFMMLVIVEISCFFLLGMPGAIKKDFRVLDLPADHIARSVGGVPCADSVFHSVKVNNGDTVYNVHFTIDKYCKRFTPGRDSLKKNFALFFGCSIGFGEGLEDNQTLPYYFQQESGKYNSYNFAASGHGTNNMLARLQFGKISDQVTERNGIGLYIFFWDHIYRAIGSMSRYVQWMHNEPYYTFDNEKLVRKLAFKDGRPFISRMYEAIYQSNIVKYFEMDFPVRLNENHYNLVSEMILESKKKYKEQFGNNDFYVVIYPSYKEFTPKQFRKFKSFLTKKRIKYIDLSDFIEYAPKYTLGGDPHPNAQTNKLIAKALRDRIMKKNFLP